MNRDRKRPVKRPVKSYVKRQGRITSGQKRALNNHLTTFGLDHQLGVFDYQAIFSRNAEVAMEIGFGNGDALIEMAKNHPDMDFIGVDVHEPGVGRLLSSLKEQQLQNVRVVMHDAVEVLQNNIPDKSLARVMIFFPDPWPKRRHHKRRLIQPEFVDVVVSKLKPCGVLHCATDWEDYAGQMLKVLMMNEYLINTSEDDTFVDKPPFRPETKFEQRGKNLGHGVWDLIFEAEGGIMTVNKIGG